MRTSIKKDQDERKRLIAHLEQGLNAQFRYNNLVVEGEVYRVKDLEHEGSKQDYSKSKGRTMKGNAREKN